LIKFSKRTKKKICFSGCWCILFIYTFVKCRATLDVVGVKKKTTLPQLLYHCKYLILQHEDGEYG